MSYPDCLSSLPVTRIKMKLHTCCRNRYREDRERTRDSRNNNVSHYDDTHDRHASRAYGDRDSRQPNRGHVRGRRDDREEHDWHVANRDSKRRRSDECGNRHDRDLEANDRGAQRRHSDYVYGDRHTSRADGRGREVYASRYTRTNSLVHISL